MAESNTDSPPKVDNPDTIPRPDLLNTAVKFLQNPYVQKSSLKHQQAFLKSKGLTEQEIKIACERSATITNQKLKDNHLETFTPSFPVLAPCTITPEPLWVKVRDIINTVVVIGGVSYGLYIFYKTYVGPWLFGIPKKKKSVEESISELDVALTTSVQDLRDSLTRVLADLKTLQDLHLQKQFAETSATAKQVDELKAELTSVKGLLLNRNQFAAPVSKTSFTPPSIPAWQMTIAAGETKDTEDEGAQCIKVDGDIEEICSSETEMVTNNGSDSSLEMIRD